VIYFNRTISTEQLLITWVHHLLIKWCELCDLAGK